MGSIDWPWVIIAFLSFGAACLLVARTFYRAGYKDAMDEVKRYLDSIESRKSDVSFERVVVSHEPLEDDDECGSEDSDDELCDGQVDPMTECTLPKGHRQPCENENIL